MDKVEVEWVDAQSSLEGIWDEDLIKEELLKSKSCGYLLHKDKEKLILVFMMFGSNWVKHYQIIPMGMVKNIKYLK